MNLNMGLSDLHSNWCLLLGDCSIRVLTDCSIRVSRSCITRMHTSNYKPTSKATVEREARSAQWGTSPMPSQRSMIESMIKPVGDQLWQRGTNCGGVSWTSCSAVSSPGGPSMVAATGPGGPILGGAVVA